MRYPTISELETAIRKRDADFLVMSDLVNTMSKNVIAVARENEKLTFAIEAILGRIEAIERENAALKQISAPK